MHWVHVFPLTWGRTADADPTIRCMVEVHLMWKGGYTSTRYMVYFLLWELQHARDSPARTCTKAMACPCARCLGHASLVWTASLGRVGDSGCICVHLCFLIFTICMWDNPQSFWLLYFSCIKECPKLHAFPHDMFSSI